MNRLKLIRTRYNYTIRDIAGKLGVSKQAVSAWENGKKAIPDARKRQLAMIFGLDEACFCEEQHKGEKSLDLSHSEEFVRRKEELKVLEDRISRSLEGPEHLNVCEQIEYADGSSLLYRRFIDVVNLLYSQKHSEKKDYHTGTLEILDGMILAMGGQINLHRDLEMNVYSEKIENVVSAKKLFDEIVTSRRMIYNID